MSKPLPPPIAPPMHGGPSLSQGNVDGLRYLEMFSYIFKSPDWVSNVLLCGICFLIPIVGPIVLLGYRYEVLEHWHRHSQADYPKFDFGRFGDYLSRGIWPFLVLVVGSFLLIPIVLLVYVLSFFVFAMGGIAGEGFAVVGAILGFGLLILGVMLAAALLGTVSIPMEMKAGLQRDFGAGFDMAFVKNFVRLTWKETVIGFLFLYAANLALTFVGLLALCIGVYFSMAILMMAQTHFEHQLYVLYLQRGGTPIPTPHAFASPAKNAPSGW